MKKEKQYALATVLENYLLPKFFKTMEKAEKFIQELGDDSNNWKIVCREVTYGDWEDVRKI